MPGEARAVPLLCRCSNSRFLKFSAGLRAQGGGTLGAEVTRHMTSRSFSWKLRPVCINVFLISCVQHWVVTAEHCEVKAGLHDISYIYAATCTAALGMFSLTAIVGGDLMIVHGILQTPSVHSSHSCLYFTQGDVSDIYLQLCLTGL